MKGYDLNEIFILTLRFISKLYPLKKCFYSGSLGLFNGHNLKFSGCLA